MANCLIGLGSNLGDCGALLQRAVEQLQAVPQTQFLAASSFRETKAAGGPQTQPAYLNAAATIETSLSPQQLLAQLQRIENELGRVREERWGPRTIDLDLLLHDQVELETPELTLPHPRMSFRRFVLEPAAEIAGEMVYPINGWRIQKLLQHQHESAPEIALSPTHSKWCPQAPATRLLKALGSEKYMQQVFRRDAENAEPTPQQLARWRKSRKNKSGLMPPSSAIVRSNAKWTVRDFWELQIDAENFSDDPLFEVLMGVQILRNPIPKLVVVWQPDDAPVMKLLERLRRHPECPPVLWIPKVPLEQARQEVIAAMAAME